MFKINSNTTRGNDTAVVGVDGCAAGWFAIRLCATGYEMLVFHSITELWTKWHDAELILIDIPIGLRDDGRRERQCDLAARRLLGQPRGCSVFPAPCWAAAHADTYEEAVTANRTATRRGLSRQCWGICRKIAEVNDFMLAQVEATKKVREVHPEVCFWAFNSGQAMQHGKQTLEGLEDRRGLLRELSREADNIEGLALAKYPRNAVARDDILDALVAALTAAEGIENLVSIPHDAEFDARGLPMEMLHVDPKRNPRS